jgi:hypothetical protein
MCTHEAEERRDFTGEASAIRLDARVAGEQAEVMKSLSYALGDPFLSTRLADIRTAQAGLDTGEWRDL